MLRCMLFTKVPILPLFFRMDVPFLTILFLTLVAFVAGFVDAIVGGGGLIMVPSMWVALPSFPVSQVVGTIKIPAFSGICIAAWQYSKKIKVNWKLISICCPLAFGMALTGSWLLTMISNDFMKPFLLFVLIAVATYTFAKKNLGQHSDRSHTPRQQILLACLVALLIGFYDGFIGPGAGSFFLLGFVALLGFPFLHASAYAKLINATTNCASVILFAYKGLVIWSIAIPMALGCTAGSLLGAKYAMAKGNGFVRKFFLVVVTAILIRFAYDVFLS